MSDECNDVGCPGCEPIVEKVAPEPRGRRWLKQPIDGQHVFVASKTEDGNVIEVFCEECGGVLAVG